ncbi:putative basic-leucine zipper transcription factor R [Senna tora]|uniref:Putative basic-leucine zipper transcription factor R n=1 Tax=Senna tora TaxID=362788 RepID=A0A834SLL7_9FABA|nr:putative basic-leucine zipper transcription factor R [Senna tora]
MDTQRGPLLTWAYYCQGKLQSMEELRQSLLYTSLELEQTRAAVGEELRKRDDQLLNLKDLLNKAIKERDEAQDKCQTLLLEKLVFQHQQQNAPAPLSGISSIEDEPRRGFDSNNGLSSSDCEESIVSSPLIDPFPQPQLPQSTIELTPDKPLPEKGKLLQAVMKAGPLLQTLLLAGPLPQWRHPPPPLESFEIPPVTIPAPHQDSFMNATNCGRVSRKRVLCEGSESECPTDTKYQRLVLH